MNTCYIVAAGDMEKVFPSPDKDDYIIAADAGYLHLKKLEIDPDLLIGDFDSMPEVNLNGKTIRYPVQKDDTDTMLAIKAGLEKGYRHFKIFGGLGGKRLDHTIANIQSLAYLAAHSADGILIGDNENIAVISDSKISLSAQQSGTVSVFSMNEKAEGVSIKGLFYPLENAEISCSFPIGTSNKFIGKEVEISVRHGILAIVWTGSADTAVISK